MKNFAPIADAMKKYSDDGAIAFHTPGHKQGRGAHSLLKNLITAEGLRQEVSLMEELDDLHDPKTFIKDAQKLAADLFNADEVFFMINGTTSAVQAMILSVLNPNDLIFVPRNAHRCVMNGLILSGARPIYLTPEFDSEFEINLNLSVETIQNAIKKYPQSKGLIIVSPNYYGISADLKKISEILHENGMFLMVDEAHGAHLHFSEKLPISAIDAGADISAQSTHKILGSLTQTSMLMMKSKLIDVERVKKSVSLLQSTSPNYLLLASLDIARLQMQQHGKELIERAINLSQRLRTAIEEIGGLKTFEKIKNFSLDLTKVTINVKNFGITGIETEKILRHKYKIQCELSDINNLLFLITFADDDFTIEKLISALKNFSSNKKINSLSKNFSDLNIPHSDLVVTPRQAFFSEKISVDLKDAINKICAEEITFYPPGIPILQFGEKITKEIVEYIETNKKIGRRIIGATDNSLSTIKIIR